MGGTLKWYWLDSETRAYGSLDCRSRAHAEALAMALKSASERPIGRIVWIAGCGNAEIDIL
jgi:hypothetical protein